MRSGQDNRKQAIEYRPGLLEPFKQSIARREHLDCWTDFPDIMWGLGFEMDCGSSFEEYKKRCGIEIGFTGSDEARNRMILSAMEHAERQVVGNYLFSEWRYCTHWAYDQDEWDYDFLEGLILLLERKYKEEALNMDILNSAICFAVEMHAGATRKGTDIPYIVHPLEAAAIASALTNDREVIAAAVLHDTVEDTPATREQIEKMFGDRIARLVAAESEDKMKDRPAADTWQERKQATIDHLKACGDKDVKIIALADKLSNLRAIHRDCERLGDNLWSRFNQKDPAKHGWYYASFLDTCKEFKDSDVYREYQYLINATFPGADRGKKEEGIEHGK